VVVRAGTARGVGAVVRDGTGAVVGLSTGTGVRVSVVLVGAATDAVVDAVALVAAAVVAGGLDESAEQDANTRPAAVAPTRNTTLATRGKTSCGREERAGTRGSRSQGGRLQRAPSSLPTPEPPQGCLQREDFPLGGAQRDDESRSVKICRAYNRDRSSQTAGSETTSVRNR
jgi:hypothetical protein